MIFANELLIKIPWNSIMLMFINCLLSDQGISFVFNNDKLWIK